MAVQLTAPPAASWGGQSSTAVANKTNLGLEDGTALRCTALPSHQPTAQPPLRFGALRRRKRHGARCAVLCQGPYPRARQPCTPPGWAEAHVRPQALRT